MHFTSILQFLPAYFMKSLSIINFLWILASLCFKVVTERHPMGVLSIWLIVIPLSLLQDLPNISA